MVSIKKLICKIVIFVVLVVVFTSIDRSVNVVISNELALTQMRNSNEMYIFVDTYNRLRPILGLIYAGMVIGIAGTLTYDIFKLVKNIKEY